VLVTNYVVEQKELSITQRQLVQCAPDVKPVDGAEQRYILRAELTRGFAVCCSAIRFFGEGLGRLFSAQMHQHCVYRYPVQPRRESGFAAEGADFSKYL
jgi:hypothetical protein